MPDASAGPPRLSDAVMTRIFRAVPTTILPSFRVQIAQHGIPQQGICAGLIAPALPPQPGNHIGVKAKSQLLLQRSIEGIADSVLPEPLRQFRDVGSIDLVVRPPREFFKTAFAPSREAAIRETLLYDFRHTVCAPSEVLFELR